MFTPHYCATTWWQKITLAPGWQNRARSHQCGTISVSKDGKTSAQRDRREVTGEKLKEMEERWKRRKERKLLSLSFSPGCKMEWMRHEGSLKKKIIECPSPCLAHQPHGPLVLSWAVINIDVVIKELSGNEDGEGGPRRDIRPAHHVSAKHVQPTKHPR